MESQTLYSDISELDLVERRNPRLFHTIMEPPRVAKGLASYLANYNSLTNKEAINSKVPVICLHGLNTPQASTLPVRWIFESWGLKTYSFENRNKWQAFKLSGNFVNSIVNNMLSKWNLGFTMEVYEALSEFIQYIADQSGGYRCIIWAPSLGGSFAAALASFHKDARYKSAKTDLTRRIRRDKVCGTILVDPMLQIPHKTFVSWLHEIQTGPHEKIDIEVLHRIANLRPDIPHLLFRATWGNGILPPECTLPLNTPPQLTLVPTNYGHMEISIHPHVLDLTYEWLVKVCRAEEARVEKLNSGLIAA